MTGRDWKPGDVLVANGVRGIVTTDAGVAEYVELSDGKCLRLRELPDGARPLVVINPEDPAQVERLVAAFWANGTDDGADILAMQATLRSLVAPPKPEEPTGLGAVVEDDDGNCWIRHGNGPAAWMLAGASPGNRDTYSYTGIPAVHVLSEGVTA